MAMGAAPALEHSWTTRDGLASLQSSLVLPQEKLRHVPGGVSGGGGTHKVTDGRQAGKYLPTTLDQEIQGWIQWYLANRI